MQRKKRTHTPIPPLRRYTAMGLAGTPDLEAGTFIVLLVTIAFYLYSQLNTFQPTLFALCFGAICALSPDMWDFIWFWKASHGNDEGDHHDRLSHSPMVGIVGWGLFGLVIGGPYFMTIGMLCITWHFIHDSWLGDGYFNWSNPFKKKPHAPSPKLLEWLPLWLRPTPRSRNEMLLGALALLISLSLSGYALLGLVLAGGHVAFNLAFWQYIRNTSPVRA